MGTTLHNSLKKLGYLPCEKKTPSIFHDSLVLERTVLRRFTKSGQVTIYVAGKEAMEGGGYLLQSV